MTGLQPPRLTVGDIVRLTHRQNYGRNAKSDERFYRMMAAAVVLLAVLALSPFEIARIRCGDYSRGPRATLLVRGRDRKRKVPVVPEVAAVLDALFRGEAGAVPAFRSSRGRPFRGGDIHRALQRAGERLGYHRCNMVELLREPARARLLKHDNAAAEVLLGMVGSVRRPIKQRHKEVGPDRLRKLVADCSWLTDKGRELVTGPVAVAFIMRSDQTLPPIPAEEEARSAGRKWPEHPAVDAMRAAKWPKKKGRHIGNSRRRHRLRHFPDIYPLLMTEIILPGQVARLFRTSVPVIEKWMELFPTQFDGKTYRTAKPRGMPDGGTLRILSDGAKAEIERICAQNRGYGPDRVTRALAERGIRVLRSRVLEHMDRNGLRPGGQLKWRFDPHCEAKVYEILGRGRIGATAMLRELKHVGITMDLGALRRHMQRLGLLGGIDAQDEGLRP